MPGLVVDEKVAPRCRSYPYPRSVASSCGRISLAIYRGESYPSTTVVVSRHEEAPALGFGQRSLSRTRMLPKDH